MEEMELALDITHIGEALVAELLKENETVQENFSDKIGCKIQKEKRIKCDVNLHHTARQKEIDKHEHLC